MEYKLCKDCGATQEECNFDRSPYPDCFTERPDEETMGGYIDKIREGV